MTWPHFLHQPQITVEKLGCCICSFNKYVLNPCYVPGIALDAGNATLKKTDTHSCPQGAAFIKLVEWSLPIAVWGWEIMQKKTNKHRTNNKILPNIQSELNGCWSWVQFQIAILVGGRDTKAVGLLIRGKGMNWQVHRRKIKEILYLFQGSENWGKEGAKIWVQRKKIWGLWGFQGVNSEPNHSFVWRYTCSILEMHIFLKP